MSEQETAVAMTPQAASELLFAVYYATARRERLPLRVVVAWEHGLIDAAWQACEDDTLMRDLALNLRGPYAPLPLDRSWWNCDDERDRFDWKRDSCQRCCERIRETLPKLPALAEVLTHCAPMVYAHG